MAKPSRCILIFTNGAHTKQYIPAMHAAFKKYRKWVIKKDKPEHNVWFDTAKSICFGHEENVINSRGKENYLTDAKHFLKSPLGLRHVDNYYAKALGAPDHMSPEMIYKSNPRFKEFAGAKVLLVGGGPSTLTNKWKPGRYDFIFSCNHFYLNPKLAAENVAFSLLGTELNLKENNTKFYDYTDKNDTLWCFETTNRPVAEMKKLFERYPKQVTYVHTRYRSKIGAMPRLMCIAALMGVKEMDVVGMDGISLTDKRGQISNHAFQKDKRFNGTFGYDLYRRQYVVLWDYILNQIGKDIKIRNLGEGNPSNMSTPITKELLK